MAPGPSEPGGIAILDLTIQTLAAGGEGVSRAADGQVVFVPGGLPGDHLRVRVVESRPRFLRAVVEERLADGPERVAPPCPLAETCGGCPWMSLAYSAQLAAKERIVAETLARVGHLSRDKVRPIVPSPREFGYRGRARLHGAGAHLGFYRAGARDLEDVASCAVLHPSLDELLGQVRRWLHPHLPLATPLQLELERRPDGGRAVALTGLGLKALPPLSLPDDVEVLRLDRPADGTRQLAFAQANPSANALLVAKVVEWLAVGPGDQVLDLYCGSGNYALPLLRAGVGVTGVEWDEAAVAEAERRSPAPERGRFIAGAAELVTEALLRKGRRFDAVILNPPRGGARELVPLLARTGARRAVYVSCDPATLARDLRLLSPAWSVDALQPYDLMPHTAHVETVALLTRRPQAA